MTIDPVAPAWLVGVVALALAAFTVWRLIVSPTLRLRVAWGLRLLAVLLLVAVALRPVIPAGPTPRPSTSGGLEVYIVVDTTSSMAAEDVDPSGDGTATRLDGVKSDIAEMASKLSGASFSLVTFDAATVQRVPLTSDASALVSASSVLSQEITQYSKGSSIDEAVPFLTTLLKADAKANPGQKRVLFYLGDGEQTLSTPPGSFAALAPFISGGAVLGYGTAEGGRMRQFTGFDDPNNPPGYIKDPQTGDDALSKIDETALNTVATQLGVGYEHREAGVSIDGLLSGFDVGTVTVSGAPQGVRTELYWIFAIPLGALVLLELLALAGALGELRRAATPRTESA